MIVADRKPFDEIMDMIDGYEKILLLGCNECVTVCAVGGTKEVALLASGIKIKRATMNRSVEIEEKTLERQCDPEYAQSLNGNIGRYDAVVSLACGCGVQFIGENYPDIPVLPAVNTRFMGVTESPGVWEERCQGCGDCMLDRTGGICPVTRCAKSILNGPCGGSRNGECELGNGVPCAWQLIIDRLKSRGQVNAFEDIEKPRDWSKSRDGGLRRRLREDMAL
ncbi:MAG: methylenetetrahydrofolate reductase C-terminal domain-containing protein [Syntrophorhabdaceae bacterium]